MEPGFFYVCLFRIHYSEIAVMIYFSGCSNQLKRNAKYSGRKPFINGIFLPILA
ncbi:hypothetical protein D3C87_83610 [compost metagenome]